MKAAVDHPFFLLRRRILRIALPGVRSGLGRGAYSILCGPSLRSTVLAITRNAVAWQGGRLG